MENDLKRNKSKKTLASEKNKERIIRERKQIVDLEQCRLVESKTICIEYE